MKNINNSMPFFAMHRDIMEELRFIGWEHIGFYVTFKGERPFRPLNELVDQLHSLNRII